MEIMYLVPVNIVAPPSPNVERQNSLGSDLQMINKKIFP